MQDSAVLISTLIAPIAAQLAKIPLSRTSDGGFDWKSSLKSGGMPSSHTALVVSLTTSCLLNYGLTSPYVAISAAISLIVIYDAMGVRRQSGEQAIVLNDLIATLEAVFGKKSDVLASTRERNKLKEVLGHKPTEVCGGIVLGVAIALFIRFIVF